MKSYGSSCGVGLLVLALGTSVSCKKEETPKPDPAAAAAPSLHATARHPPQRGPGARMDPQANKDHRVDYCYYGTFSLRQARDAYLASLGKDEPSAKKIPSLGAPVLPPSPGASATPGAKPPAPGTPAPAAKPPLPAVKPAAPGTPGSGAPHAPPPGTLGPTDHRNDPGLRLPHERNARSCTSALGLKEPPMPDVDAQMAVFAPFAVELAKDISAAQTYYQQQEYTKDNFARGKELDKKLRDEFAKLDDLSDKLGAAIAGWRKEHPLDESKMEEGEKIARGAVDAARDVFLLVATHRADGEAWKSATDKLDKSAEALKTFGDAHPADVWSKQITLSVDPFVKLIKGAKITPDKSVDPDTYLSLVTGFTAMLEGRLRASTRAMMTRPPPPLPLASGAPAAPGAPAQPAP